MATIECPACDGEVDIGLTPCGECHGEGTLEACRECGGPADLVGGFSGDVEVYGGGIVGVDIATYQCRDPECDTRWSD